MLYKATGKTRLKSGMECTLGKLLLNPPGSHYAQRLIKALQRSKGGGH